jgi:predicted O-methyltransferase YrrM
LLKLKQLLLALKWQRQVRAALSTHLSLLEHPALFALGGLTDEETQGLAELARSVNPAGGPIIEFGTLFGLTTLVLAEHKPKTVKLITLDNFHWNPFGLPAALHQDFTRRILCASQKQGQVELVASDSQSFRDGYQGPVPGLVFLDADHSYRAVREEIAWAVRLGVPLVCGHDYGNPRFGATQAVDEAFPDGVNVRGMVWWVRS